MPTTIAFSCPACRLRIEAPAALAGRRGKCKGCGGPLAIPTPRSAVPKVPPRPAEDEPLELSEEDAIDDVPLAAPPMRTATKAQAAPKPAKSATSKAKGKKPAADGVDLVTGVVLGMLGIVALIAGLLLVEVLTFAAITKGLRMRGRGAVNIVFGIPLLLLYGGVAGLAKLTRAFTPRVDEETLKTAFGALVAVVTLLVIAARWSGGGDSPPVIARLIQGWF